MGTLSFLQENGQWICAVGMVVFAFVQVCLMHAQNRQQIRFQRSNLAQELNYVCTHFPYTKNDCNRIMDWLMAHGASFTFLLNNADMKRYWNLYMFISELVFCKDENYFEDMDKQDKFYECVMKLESVLREAAYGIPKHNRSKLKFFKRWFHAKH